MSKQEWTKEPWRYSFGEEGVYRYDDWGSIRGADDMLVTRCNTGAVCYERELDMHRKNKTDPTEPNARRIVDCVNALTGIVSPSEYISSLRQENERLRGALKPFSDALDDCDDEELLPENDKWEVWERPCGMSINTGHLKSARQALTKEG